MNLRVALLTATLTLVGQAAAAPTLLLVSGAPGTDAYATTFSSWAEKWEQAAKRGGLAVQRIQSIAALRESLASHASTSTEPLWLVLLGHGTASAGDGKFNLQGDDVSANQLADWLQPMQRPLVAVCGFSASGAFLKPLAGPNRVVVTATRSGNEIQFSRFGGALAEALATPEGDLDQDGQTSLLEGFVAASRTTQDFYREAGRLATEHALLDDNGDGMGTPGDWFQGIRAVKKPSGSATVDGARAHQIHLIPSEAERSLTASQRKQRDALEQKIEALRAEKAKLSEAEYLRQLEVLLVELAKVYEGQKPPSRAE